MKRGRGLRGSGGVWLAWLALSVALWAVVAPRVQLPGLYYDEAFMAQQAKDFFEPERGIHHPSSTRETEIFGRPFPLRNAVYLGALKSQLLIPSFALLGTDVPVLRLTTLATSLLALLCIMLWAARILGPAVAVVAGALVALDPSYVFLSTYEWGPFTTILLCRSAGFLLVTAGWTAGRALPMAAGGLCLGLGVYSRADCAVVIVAGVAALAAVRPGILREAWGPRRGLVAVLLLGAALGAAPMLLSLGDLLATGSHPVLERRGDLTEKLRVLWSLADGSHFQRLMAVGGRFDRMFAAPAPATLFGPAALVAACAALAQCAVRLRRRAPLDGRAFVFGTGCLVAGGMLLVPGAVRAHHLLNVLPFFHLVAAAAAADLWNAFRGRLGRAMRIALVGVFGVVFLSDLRVIAETYRLIEATGGRGRWADAIREPAAELEARSEARGISLDWGLHEPLLFLTRRAQLLEPIWEIPEQVRARGAWRFEGRAGDLYLVHDRAYDVFGYGPRFLATARALADRSAGVEIRAHRDREGAVAFWSVRFSRDHELSYRRRFRVRFHEPRAP